MHINNWIVVGAGGHGSVVMDALILSCHPSESLSFVDDNSSRHGELILGKQVLGFPNDEIKRGTKFHVAIGLNEKRESLYSKLIDLGGEPFGVVHPLASISKYSKFDKGCFFAAYSVIAPLSIIGKSVIVNHGAVIDHETIVGNFSHVAPGATIAGGVTIGNGVLIGAGANILPGIKIGDGVVVGAGAVVTTDVPNGFKVAGVPAKKI